jgi:hypothetical protein
MIDLAATDPQALHTPFGEYLARKWAGVQSQPSKAGSDAATSTRSEL